MTSSDYPPRKPNPPWMIWAVAGVTTVLVVGIVGIAIAGMGKAGGRGASLAQSAPPTNTTRSPQQSAEAVEELRSHMPADLRSMTECQETDPGTKATASIECQWEATAVPNFAIYRSYADTDSMNADAEQAHKSETPGQSCDSEADFTTGGRTTWAMDNQGGGTVWCYLNENKEPVILRTDDTLHILAGATAPALGDWQRLRDWMTGTGRPE